MWVSYYNSYKRIIIIIILFICIFIFTQLSLRFVTKVARDEKLDVPLPDLFHQALPEYMREWHEYSDWVPLIPLILFIILDKGKHYYKFIFMISLIYLMRAISFSITVLPSPSRDCVCEWEQQPETPLRSFLNILYQEGCNDLIFSGHTSMMIMSTLFLLYYCLPDNTFIHILFLIYNIMGCLIIIGTRLHYSTDVFIASVINILLFFSFLPKN